jgi:hypothetical protein
MAGGLVGMRRRHTGYLASVMCRHLQLPAKPQALNRCPSESEEGGGRETERGRQRGRREGDIGSSHPRLMMWKSS